MTTIGLYRPGEDAYVLPGDFPSHGLARRWLFHGIPRSQQMRDKSMVKNWLPFDEHQDEGSMLDLLEECHLRGVVRPSSYSDLFAQCWKRRPIRAAVRKMFPRVPGAWQQIRYGGTSARGNFVVRDHLRKYDIRSAYLSALRESLPDPATFLTVKKVSGPGLYWCESPALAALCYPWNTPGWFPATEEELSALPLNFRGIRRGVAFIPGEVDTARMIGDIQAWTCWKAVARMYWGRWASAPGGLSQQTFTEAGDVNTESEIGNPAFNPVWASIITSRLRLRLFRLVDSMPVYRVFTDSIVTTAEMDVGPNIGDWQLEDDYPRGGIVTINGVKPFTLAA